ncbi:hypothetical protein NKI12_18220 [Mesorhizobium australicum]|uniref:Uncharacterized protein n=1 Tax=Mesorhizobium australicum TaxID=536018 RepID=A0ACC6T0U7_9HYPH
MSISADIGNFSLDSRQLARIEYVHRGFLYQHLYAVACLFRAAQAGVTHVVVENDEDVELVFSAKRIYAQIKTRSSDLVLSDIEGPFRGSKLSGWSMSKAAEAATPNSLSYRTGRQDRSWQK